MSTVTIKSNIILLEKELGVEFKARETKFGKKEKEKKYAIYDTTVQWDKKSKSKATVQWARHKYKENNKKTGKDEDKTSNSFTLLPGFELKISAIPGLDIQIADPISIKFNRLSIGGNGHGRFFPIPEKKKDPDPNETTEQRKKREKKEKEEKEGIPFTKVDYEVVVKVWGEEKRLVRSEMLKKAAPEDKKTPKPADKDKKTPKPADKDKETPKPAEEETKPQKLAETKDDTTWMKVDKSVSGLHLKAIGIRWEEGKICVVIDASVTLAGFKFGVMGLEAKVKPATMFSAWPEFDLKGLEVGYYSDNVSLGAALLKETITVKVDNVDTDVTQFTGAALLKLKNFKLTMYGVGMYAKIKDKTSLFLYFGLNYPLGGPPFFSVQGLSVGLGYNRRLQLNLEEIQDFPLVKLALDGDKAASGDGGLLQLASDLAPYIPPSMGDIFIMAGVRFDTFKLVESVALFVVYLGEQFNLQVYGLSRLEISRNNKKYVYIAIQIKGEFNPAEGFVKIDGAVTDDSFVISKDIRLSGGFAFYTWWKGDYAGDFVLTVGGYHPEYKVPSHYPTPKRLGLDWKVSDNFSMSGKTYLALTPKAIMMGMDVKALFNSSNFKALFRAGFHFLLQWDPFYYDISAYIEITIWFRIHMDFGWFGSVNKTIKLGAGASLRIRGPEFSVRGRAYLEINLGFKTIRPSASISIGREPTTPKALTWSEFKTKMLPPDNALFSVNPTEGLIDKKEAKERKDEILILNPKSAQFQIESAIPVNVVNYNKKVVAGTKDTPFYVTLMKGNQIKKSTLHIVVKKASGDLATGEFEASPIQKNMPSGLWGNPKDSKDLSAPSLVKDINSGILLTSKSRTKIKDSLDLPLSSLAFQKKLAKNKIQVKTKAFELDELKHWTGGESIALDDTFYKVLKKDAEYQLV